MSLHILIPCKPLRDGKSRLAPVLSPAERQALCARLLHRSLALALALRPAGNIDVITPDAAAKAIAAEYGVDAIDDGGAGLNDALQRGRDHIIEKTGEGASALILPIDLPLATADAVRRAIGGNADVALAPDEQRSGTNLLHIGRPALRTFRFAFGPDSFSAHRDWAEQAGFRVATIDDPLLAFDIDRPEDYDHWQRRSAVPTR
jgi:2-phospho-L-lactate/phosphoenolpyruvate guanylyltransferase